MNTPTSKLREKLASVMLESGIGYSDEMDVYDSDKNNSIQDSLDILMPIIEAERTAIREQLERELEVVPCHSHNLRTVDGKIPTAILWTDLLAIIHKTLDV